MFVLYEDNGNFRTGTVLVDNDASLQVEATTGKRLKIKKAQVLMRFQEPAPGSLLEQAREEAESLDTDFLWEVCGDEEFTFDEFAAEYHGDPPTTVQMAATLLSLHSAPIYFHRKGKGRFRKAPPEILQAALAGLEKKRQQAEAIERMRAELVSGRLPEELAGMVPQLLYRPDRNRPEVKALEAACVDSGQSAPRLLLACGAIESSHEYHYNRFLFEHFPDGSGFPAFEMPSSTDELPLAAVQTFSLDDATTTEIDDAFSVTPREGGGWRVGIHIAAPGLSFARGSTLDAIARDRLSTVYMPGNKLTMLPDEIVQHCTLLAGRECPAVSLYLDLSPALAVLGSESRIERIPVTANLRHHEVEPLFNDDFLHSQDERPEFPWQRELVLLWELATVLEAGRGKTAAAPEQTDYSFYVDWNIETADGPGHVTISSRRRGAPVDKLVSELMIHANATWGKQLDEAGIPGLYRVQFGGKVRMSTNAEPHEALGVDCYAWSSSPLRRYVDLVNQWQIIAAVQGTEPPFAPRSSDLMAALRDFELTYAAYGEFQRMMERYWCMRWLRQNECKEVTALVLRENVVRIDGMPLVIRVPSMPLQMPGAQVRLAIDGSDLIDLDVSARYLTTLSEPSERCATSLP